MNNIEQNHHQQHQQSSSKTSSIDETKRMRYGVKNNLSRSPSSSITSSSIKLSPLSLTATATTVSPSYPKPPLQFQQPDQSSFVFAASKNRSHRLQTFHSFDETNHWLPARSDNIFPLENRTNFVPIDRNNSVRCFDLEQATLAQNKNDDLFDDIVDGRQHHSLIESNSNKRFDSKSKRSKLDRLKSKKNCYQINPINLTARIENNLVETVLEHCDDCVDGEEDREHRHRHQIVSNDLIQNSSAFLPREPSTSSSLSTTSSESASFELDNRNCFESNVPIEPPELFNNNNNNNNNNRTDNTENGSSVSNDQLNQVNNHHHFDRSDETFESKQFLKRFVTKTSDPSTSSTAVASTNPVSFLIHQRRTNRNSATFWDLITDVAKDLDLELQDISPDGEFVLDHRQHQQSTTTTTATKTSKSVTKSSASKVKTKVVVNDLNSNNYNSNTDNNTQQQQQQHQQQQQKQTRKQIVLPAIKATNKIVAKIVDDDKDDDNKLVKKIENKIDGKNVFRNLLETAITSSSSSSTFSSPIIVDIIASSSSSSSQSPSTTSSFTNCNRRRASEFIINNIAIANINNDGIDRAIVASGFSNKESSSANITATTTTAAAEAASEAAASGKIPKLSTSSGCVADQTDSYTYESTASSTFTDLGPIGSVGSDRSEQNNDSQSRIKSDQRPTTPPSPFANDRKDNRENFRSTKQRNSEQQQQQQQPPERPPTPKQFVRIRRFEECLQQELPKSQSKHRRQRRYSGDCCPTRTSFNNRYRFDQSSIASASKGIEWSEIFFTTTTINNNNNHNNHNNSNANLADNQNNLDQQQPPSSSQQQQQQQQRIESFSRSSSSTKSNEYSISNRRSSHRCQQQQQQEHQQQQQKRSCQRSNRRQSETVTNQSIDQSIRFIQCKKSSFDDIVSLGHQTDFVNDRLNHQQDSNYLDDLDDRIRSTTRPFAYRLINDESSTTRYIDNKDHTSSSTIIKNFDDDGDDVIEDVDDDFNKHLRHKTHPKPSHHQHQQQQQQQQRQLFLSSTSYQTRFEPISFNGSFTSFHNKNNHDGNGDDTYHHHHHHQQQQEQQQQQQNQMKPLPLRLVSFMDNKLSNKNPREFESLGQNALEIDVIHSMKSQQNCTKNEIEEKKNDVEEEEDDDDDVGDVGDRNDRLKMVENKTFETFSQIFSIDSSIKFNNINNNNNNNNNNDINVKREKDSDQIDSLEQRRLHRSHQQQQHQENHFHQPQPQKQRQQQQQKQHHRRNSIDKSKLIASHDDDDDFVASSDCGINRKRTEISPIIIENQSHRLPSQTRSYFSQSSSTKKFLHNHRLDENDADRLPEANVDSYDEEEDELDEREDIIYEMDADDEQSNEMLDDDEDEDDEDVDNHRRSSITPPSTTIFDCSKTITSPSSMITKIDLSKSVVQVISLKMDHDNDQVFNDEKLLKESSDQLPESEDSAADVSYERTSENESDIEDTTITTVNTSNPNNVDLREMDHDQRFKMTQSIWYLPHINRATVVHYLQGKSIGVFIVRKSSKPNTMAVSVRLPQGRGPHVEHYLIEKIVKPPNKISSSSSASSSPLVFHLEGSEHYFNSILQLVIHYSNCQDELPIQLSLPSVLLTSSRSQLASLALLGQEFWQSKFVSLKHLPKNSLNTEQLALVNANQICEESNVDQSNLQATRQQLKRHSSNSSESNASKSSMSRSPMPNTRSRLISNNDSEHSNDSQRPSDSITPSPIQNSNSKFETNENPLIQSKKSFDFKNDNDNLGALSIEMDSDFRNFIAKLPPRSQSSRAGQAPPPIPPRSRNPTGSTPPPLPINGPPLASLRSMKPSSKSSYSQDLLSPISSKDLEMEMGKLSMSHKLASNILEVDEIDYDDEELAGGSKTRLNYYNHMIQVAKSSPSPIQKSPSSQSQSPQKLVSQPQSSIQPQSLDSARCDVYTQTYETKNALGIFETSNKDRNNINESNINRPCSSLSCFYMDPIDALVAVHKAHAAQHPKRHSDPELASSSHTTTTINDLDSTTNQTLTLSHSLESLLELFRNRFSSAVSSSDFNSIRKTILNERKNMKSINVGHPNVVGRSDAFSTIDSAWQWYAGNYQAMLSALKMPISKDYTKSKRSSIATSETIKSDITTVEDLISAKVPELAVPKITQIDSLQSQNQFDVNHNERRSNLVKSIATTNTDTSTEFSEPWNLDLGESRFLNEINEKPTHLIDNSDDLDLSKQLLNNDLINFNSFLLNHDQQQQHAITGNEINPLMLNTDDDYDNVADDDDEEIDDQNLHLKRVDSDVTIKQSSFVPGLISTSVNDDGIKLNIAFNISNYVFELANRKNNTFAKSIENFIQCTKETTDPSPSLILGYVRQFMNGMKNYLMKNGEGDFLQVVQNERSRLRPNQFLNIDAILEVSLQKLIIKPLKNFIYELFIRNHTMSGSLKILSTNIKLAQNKSAEELGIRSELMPIEPKIMAEIQKNLRRLQQSYSPIKKLEHLLKCVTILNGYYRDRFQKCQQSKHRRSFSGDDLLPMFVYLIVSCGVISAEIESEYMLGLLHPSIMNGDGSYYLTVLSSAIQVLKTMYAGDNSRQLEDIITLNGSHSKQSMISVLQPKPSEAKLRGQINGSASALKIGSQSSSPLALPSIANLQAYMKIMIPNELTSSITSKIVPVRYNMTTKEVCRMIAHTFRVSNPEDHALYRIKENGLEEIQMLDNDFPQVIKSELLARGETAMFAYKRCDAKFVWPITNP